MKASVTRGRKRHRFIEVRRPAAEPANRRPGDTEKAAPARWIDAPGLIRYHFTMSSLAEIEPAAEALPPEQQHPLMLFLGDRLQPANADGLWNLPPAECAADLLRWAASHADGPGLPDSAVGRDAIHEPV